MEDGSSSPQVIDQPDIYIKGKQRGNGQFATTHEAVNARNAQSVILKEPLERGAVYEKEFTAEAKTLAKLEHPNILPILNVYTEKDGTPVIVTKKISGPNFDEYLTQKNETGQLIPISDDEKLHLIEQVSSAVDYVNGENVLHRDIKPKNILVSHGNAYLADFGSSSPVINEENGTHESGMVVGSPAFMSPEQVQGIEKPGDSEEYAVALLAYTVLTGKTVYEYTPTDPAQNKTNEITQKMFAVATRNGLPEGAKAKLMEKYPATIDVFNKGLARKPEDRYQTATEFAKALGESIKMKK
jgi:serine/threonine protein kinase